MRCLFFMMFWQWYDVVIDEFVWFGIGGVVGVG